MMWLTTATFWPGMGTPRPCSCSPANACGLVYSFIRCRSQNSRTFCSSSLATVWESTSFGRGFGLSWGVRLGEEGQRRAPAAHPATPRRCSGRRAAGSPRTSSATRCHSSSGSKQRCTTPSRAPQRKQRRVEAPAARAVAAVVLEVDAGRGAVVLAEAMRGARLAPAALVTSAERARVERCQAGAAAAHHVAHVGAGSASMSRSGSGAGWIRKNQCQ